MPSQSTPTIALVVAVAENGVIGRNGALPWRLSSDLKTFRAVTMGKPLIMGRRTYQSLRGPLDGRDNIVVSRGETIPRTEGIYVVRTIEEALALARTCADSRGAGEIMVIGGSDIFAATLPQARRIYWTQVEGSPEGDTHFPPFDAHDWHITERHELTRGPKDDFSCTFKILERTVPPRDSTLGGAAPPPSLPPS